MIDREKFFFSIRGPLFGGALSERQVEGMTAILDCWDRSGYTDLRWLAYDLATVYHETAKEMWPIKEFGEGRGHKYGWPAGPWHKIYFGRGDEQITWLRNYGNAQKRLAARSITVALVKDPDLALRPDVAAAIVIYGNAEGWFTGKKLGDYFSPTKDDPLNARRIVNGLDRAALIAGYYGHFRAALSVAAPIETVAMHKAVAAASSKASDAHASAAALTTAAAVAAPIASSAHLFFFPWWGWVALAIGAIAVVLILLNRAVGLSGQAVAHAAAAVNIVPLAPPAAPSAAPAAPIPPAAPVAASPPAAPPVAVAPAPTTTPSSAPATPPK